MHALMATILSVAGPWFVGHERRRQEDRPEEAQEPIIDTFEEACHTGCKVLRSSDVELKLFTTTTCYREEMDDSLVDLCAIE